MVPVGGSHCYPASLTFLLVNISLYNCSHSLGCINIGMRNFGAISSYVLLWFAHLNNNLSCILAKFLAQYQVFINANWKQQPLLLTGGHVDMLTLLFFVNTLVTTYFSFRNFKLDSILLLPTFYLHKIKKPATSR